VIKILNFLPSILFCGFFELLHNECSSYVHCRCPLINLSIHWKFKILITRLMWRLSQRKLICEFSIGKCLDNVFIAELKILFWAILSSSQSEYLLCVYTCLNNVPSWLVAVLLFCAMRSCLLKRIFSLLCTIKRTLWKSMTAKDIR
jgi:hypothetical protein